KQGQDKMLRGWLGKMMPHYGTKVVDDHAMWPYFAKRFGLKVVGHLEPKPGIAPTTQHLQKLVEKMRAANVRVVLSSPYFHPRHAQFVQGATQARIAEMAHQGGARPGTDDYLRTVDYNVQQVVKALGSE